MADIKENLMRTEGQSRPAAFPEIEDLSELIGNFIHYWGFKRIHGRIWTHLYLANKPLDAADLVSQLSISKALVSISLRELLDFQVIEEVGKSDRGTHLYRTNPDILSVILSVLRQREKRMISRISAACETMSRVSAEEKARNGISQKSVEQLNACVHKAIFALESFISMKSVDFGDWHDMFLMADLKEEAALRAQTTASTTEKTKTESHEILKDFRESTDEDASLDLPKGQI